MICYLAGAIDLAPNTDALAWRLEAAERLSRANITTFSPAHAFYLSVRPPLPVECRAMMEINMEALHRATLMLVNLAGMSFGTPIEVHRCDELNKPVVAFGGIDKRASHYLRAMIPDEMHFPTMQEAIDRIPEMDRSRSGASRRDGIRLDGILANPL